MIYAFGYQKDTREVYAYCTDARGFTEWCYFFHTIGL